MKLLTEAEGQTFHSIVATLVTMGSFVTILSLLQCYEQGSTKRSENPSSMCLRRRRLSDSGSSTCSPSWTTASSDKASITFSIPTPSVGRSVRYSADRSASYESDKLEFAQIDDHDGYEGDDTTLSSLTNSQTTTDSTPGTPGKDNAVTVNPSRNTAGIRDHYPDIPDTEAYWEWHDVSIDSAEFMDMPYIPYMACSDDKTICDSCDVSSTSTSSNTTDREDTSSNSTGTQTVTRNGSPVETLSSSMATDTQSYSTSNGSTNDTSDTDSRSASGVTAVPKKKKRGRKKKADAYSASESSEYKSFMGRRFDENFRYMWVMDRKRYWRITLSMAVVAGIIMTSSLLLLLHFKAFLAARVAGHITATGGVICIILTVWFCSTQWKIPKVSKFVHNTMLIGGFVSTACVIPLSFYSVEPIVFQITGGILIGTTTTILLMFMLFCVAFDREQEAQLVEGMGVEPKKRCVDAHNARHLVLGCSLFAGAFSATGSALAFTNSSEGAFWAGIALVGIVAVSMIGFTPWLLWKRCRLMKMLKNDNNL